MKPTAINSVLDLAQRARQQGKTFNPCFVSAPGLGKSEIVQQWAEKNGYALVDIRTALLEAPDLIGFPEILTKDGRQRTVHALPDFWPDNSNGKTVLFIDEINRGTTSVMNCFMQLLTDRKIKDYKLPEDTLIVAAINPENEQNDVNAMDSALKDRLEFFHIEYDKKTHVKFMEDTNYDPVIRLFVESGTWQYCLPEEVSDTPGAKYLSPRTFSKLNNALKAGILETVDFTEHDVYDSILGSLMGRAFWQFKNNEQPVTFEEIKKSVKKSMKRLSGFCDPKNYKTGHVSITIRSLIENEKDVTDDMLYNVAVTIGPEQAVSMLKEIGYKRNNPDILTQLAEKYDDLAAHIKATLKKEQTK